MVAALPAESSANSRSLPQVKTPKSRDEADQLILELGRMDAIEARNQADFERASAALKSTYSARNIVKVGDREVAIADRRTQHETALGAYWEANKETLVDDKRRSVKLNFGTLGSRKQPDFLEPVDGQSSAGRASLLDRLHEHLCDALLKFKELTPAALSCMNPQLTWRKSALIAARQDKRIESDELRKIGYRLVDGEDHFYIKPGPVDLSSQPSLAP